MKLHGGNGSKEQQQKQNVNFESVSRVELFLKMLDFFTIFSKGGIVLWYFQGTVGNFEHPVNELIKNVVLQVKFFNTILNF